MLLHQTSGRWRLGLSLSLVTSLLWGIMPNVLAIALQTVDPITLTWFRFLSSFLLLGLYRLARMTQVRTAAPLKSAPLKSAPLELKPWRRLHRFDWLLLLIAILGVGLDYPLYLLGMHQTSPANAEVMIQLAPVLMGLGGIVIFRERYSPSQWVGVAVLFAGFALFFDQQLRSFTNASAQYLWGSGLVLLAAVCWAAYALAQKQLLRHLPSDLIMLTIYGYCALLYLPLAQPQQFLGQDGITTAILLSCGLSTLISYGAFAESLAHWDASKISAIQSLTPVITIATSWMISTCWPTVMAPAHLGLTALVGAGLVIAGSMAIALGQKLRQSVL
ncbi:MAG: DMT family transporter [Elainella sp.]